MKRNGQPPECDTAYGAEWLFAAWPFRKFSGGNIGAVQLPPRKAALVPFTMEMLQRPFETKPNKERQLRRSIYRALSELD
jgi:hypothetical protein